MKVKDLTSFIGDIEQKLDKLTENVLSTKVLVIRTAHASSAAIAEPLHFAGAGSLLKRRRFGDDIKDINMQQPTPINKNSCGIEHGKQFIISIEKINEN